MNNRNSKLVENSGVVVIKKGEYGKIIPHNVEKLRGHELKANVEISKYGHDSNIVAIEHILHNNVLIILVCDPDPLSHKIVPAPCNITVCWSVYNDPLYK